MQRKKTAAGYVYDFENGYELSFSERVGEFMLYRNNKPQQLGRLSHEAKLTTEQEAQAINFLNQKNPDLDALWELLWGGEDEEEDVDEDVEEDVDEDEETAPPRTEVLPVPYTRADRMCVAVGTAGLAFAVAVYVGGFVAALRRWR